MCKWGHDLTLPGAKRYDKRGRSGGCYECHKARLRHRYATDPEYRAAQLARSKAWYARRKW